MEKQQQFSFSSSFDSHSDVKVCLVESRFHFWL